MKVSSYRTIRPQIEDGDLVFVRNGTTLTSKVIQVCTRSIYSHVGIAFWTQIASTRRLMVIEAQGGSTRRIISMSFYENAGLDIIKAPRPWEEYADEALESVGQAKYGWMDAFYVGMREGAFKYFNTTLPFRDFSGEICSEFAARMLQLENVHVSPQGLVDELTRKGHSIVMQAR
jgi:hypothetical protein